MLPPLGTPFQALRRMAVVFKQHLNVPHNRIQLPLPLGEHAFSKWLPNEGVGHL